MAKGGLTFLFAYYIGMSYACDLRGFFAVYHSYVVDIAAKLKPEVVSYSAVISACEKGSMWGVVLRFLDAMMWVRFQHLEMKI